MNKDTENNNSIKITQINSKLSVKNKAILDAIKKENKKITPRYILEEFIKDYCSTEPKGINLEIKELEKKKTKIKDKINKLYEDETKIEIEIKIRKDKLNKTLDIYIDEDLIKAVNSILDTCQDNNIERFEDIPEVTLINIAKYNKIDLETLKQEVKKKI